MNDKPYSIIKGEFVCQRCKEKVDASRFWRDTKDITWQCSKKHISKVSLAVKKGY